MPEFKKCIPKSLIQSRLSDCLISKDARLDNRCHLIGWKSINGSGRTREVIEVSLVPTCKSESVRVMIYHLEFASLRSGNNTTHYFQCPPQETAIQTQRYVIPYEVMDNFNDVYFITSKKWQCGDPYQYPVTEKGDQWQMLLKPLLEKDHDQCQSWKDEVQNLLIFVSAMIRRLVALDQ